MLERLSYYGVRAIFILFLIDDNGLNLTREVSLNHYSKYSFLLLLLPIPLGYLIDKLLKEKRAIIIVSLLCLGGYLLLLTSSLYGTVVSLILLAIGLSIIKPTTTILVGRQFHKANRRRTLAYMVYFLGINLGSFIGVVTIGYLGEKHGWNYGFLLAAVATALNLLLFLVFGQKIVHKETNLVQENKPLNNRKALMLLLILAIIQVAFWYSYNSFSNDLTTNLVFGDDEKIFGLQIIKSFIQAFHFIWYCVLGILLFTYWYTKGIGRTFDLIKLAFGLLIFAVLASIGLNYSDSALQLELSIPIFGLFVLAETIFSPLCTSYLTRISNVKYSHTLYGLFFFVTYLLGNGLSLIPENISKVTLIAFPVLTILSLMFFKNKIYRLSKEID